MPAVTPPKHPHLRDRLVRGLAAAIGVALAAWILVGVFVVLISPSNPAGGADFGRWQYLQHAQKASQ